MRANIFLFAYGIVSVINLWAGYAQNETLIFYSKPLLLPLLALWFYFQTQPDTSTFRKLILWALVFSWGGDVLLMFVESHGEHFFLMGLSSFLIAHILYAKAFFKTVPFKNGYLKKNIWALLPFVIIYLGFNYQILPNMPSVMEIPVGVYGMVIMTMAVAALNRYTFVPQNTFILIFLGALIFMFSDMTIAVNKFKTPITHSHIWIMSTYLLGQYLIVKGSIGAIEN